MKPCMESFEKSAIVTKNAYIISIECLYKYVFELKILNFVNIVVN